MWAKHLGLEHWKEEEKNEFTCTALHRTAQHLETKRKKDEEENN
jgi:hypothetical protein